MKTFTITQKEIFSRTLIILIGIAISTPLLQAGDIYSETFGTNAIVGTPTPRTFKGWDDTQVAYSSTTSDLPEIRSTATLSNHLWFPWLKTTDMVISGINLASYENLVLSFDLATYSSLANITNEIANPSKLSLFYNGDQITIPSTPTFTGKDQYLTISLPLSEAESGTLRFLITAENNPQNCGYRLDNIRITGTSKTPGGINNTVSDDGKPVLTGHILHLNTLTAGTRVSIYNILGQSVRETVAEGSQISLEGLPRGTYIVKVNKSIYKVQL